ncbi:DUF827 domain-containing protein [Cephalotus follicularis]|uniref:DUF827 domain-containing protein n=1 Tax=Cephalotus follicularis TaxID=3775 RepID=A0A1Q3B375_CEPFO|nr:DUF827 domain-containing protein [Cephalotus follicularis]
MAVGETTLETLPHLVPGTPGIREVRSDSGSGEIPGPGIRRVGLRAVIDTSPPFGSVKEAVTRFGGSGSWMPCHYNNGVEEFDIKKAEEQAAELEKDLIVKELETLDILEELATTKKFVEELKRQLQQEAFKCLTIPELQSDEHMSITSHIKEMNKEHHGTSASNREQIITSSPDMILMELKQANLNLGKTINDLGAIQLSVESLNRKMKKEKTLIEKTRERLTSKFAGVSSLEEELKHARVNSNEETNGGFKYPKSFTREIRQLNSNAVQFKKMGDAARTAVSRAVLGNEQNKTNMNTAEMRWIAAKKMEEAARAAEALAIAEIKALSGNNDSSGYFLTEPMQSPLNPRAQKPDGLPKKKLVHGIHQLGQANMSKLTVIRKLEDATEEVVHSKQAIEEALNRIEIANGKQIAAEEVLRKWMPENAEKVQAMYNDTNLSNFNPAYDHQNSPLNYIDKSNLANNETKRVSRPTVSMRDILSTKQILTQNYVTREQNEGHNQRQKVALSQMLNELRGDLAFQPKSEKEGGEQKQCFAQRRKFGFIHVSLPLTKQSKKKMQDHH